MIERQVIEQRRPPVADVLVTSADGWPVALVEVKNRPRLTPEIATSLRSTLLEHGMASPRVPYFLVVSQDVGFLWAQERQRDPDDPPTAEFPMQQVVSRYARWLPLGERLIGGTLDYVVADWLSDLSVGFGPQIPEATEPLEGSGFLELLKGATVTINVQE
jgi:hypothetical protein